MWKLDWMWFYANVSSGFSFENHFQFGQIQFVQNQNWNGHNSYSPKWVPTQQH
jgi:hypothetical protein